MAESNTSSEEKFQAEKSGVDIYNRVSNALDATAYLEHTIKSAQIRNRPPMENEDVRNAAIDAQGAIMAAYLKLRPHIIANVEEEWREKSPLANSDGAREDGFPLDDIRGKVIEEEMEIENRYTADETITYYRASTLTLGQIFTYTDLLAEMVEKLGFGPRADPKTERTEITEDEVKDWEQWRQRQLEKNYDADGIPFPEEFKDD